MNKKEKEKFKKDLNVAAIQINTMKHTLGPLWRSYYDRENKKRLFRPRYISR